MKYHFFQADLPFSSFHTISQGIFTLKESYQLINPTLILFSFISSLFWLLEFSFLQGFLTFFQNQGIFVLIWPLFFTRPPYSLIIPCLTLFICFPFYVNFSFSKGFTSFMEAYFVSISPSAWMYQGEPRVFLAGTSSASLAARSILVKLPDTRQVG
jgi:hypothetical protein